MDVHDVHVREHARHEGESRVRPCRAVCVAHLTVGGVACVRAQCEMCSAERGVSMRSRAAADIIREQQSLAARAHNQLQRNCKGETPLHRAAADGDAGRVRKLLLGGFPVNVRDCAGWAPLPEAAARGHVGAARVLLEFGADATAGAHDGTTPLHDAVASGTGARRPPAALRSAPARRENDGTRADGLADSESMKQLLIRAANGEMPATTDEGHCESGREGERAMHARRARRRAVNGRRCSRPDEREGRAGDEVDRRASRRRRRRVRRH